MGEGTFHGHHEVWSLPRALPSLSLQPTLLSHGEGGGPLTLAAQDEIVLLRGGEGVRTPGKMSCLNH